MGEFSWIKMFTQPYAEDGTLLNDWVEQCLAHAKGELFENQENWLYMANEVGAGMPPKFKENARDIMWRACMNQFSWLADYMVDRLVTEYRLSNIDLDENTIWNMELDLPDGDYAEWEQQCRERIFKEYEEHLGHDKAVEYCKSIWTEGWLPE